MGDKHKPNWTLRGTFAALALFAGSFFLKSRESSNFEQALEGQHQFTVLADTDHTRPEIMVYVSQNVDAMAEAGIKHIMLEREPVSDDISSLFPDIKGTAEEKLVQITQMADNYVFEISEAAKALQKENPSLSRGQAWEQVATIPENQERYKNIMAAQLLLEVAMLLDGVHKDPSEENFQKLRLIHPFLVNAGSPHTLEDKNKQSLAVVETIIQAAKRGIRVHFTDHGTDHPQSEKEREIYKQISRLYAENPDLEEHYKRCCREGIDYITTLDVSEQERQKIYDNLDQLLALMQQYPGISDDRTSPEAEEARADLFIELAQGERAVIIWGANHFWKSLDINEYLDQKLREADASAASTKVMDIWVSEQAYKDVTLITGETHDDPPDITHFLSEDKTPTPK